MYEFSCFVLNEDDTKRVRVGGSTNEPAAVAIACAVYQAMQADTTATSPDVTNKIAVFDALDVVVAMVGADEE